MSSGRKTHPKVFKTHKAPRARVRSRPQPSSRATYADLVTIDAKLAEHDVTREFRGNMEEARAKLEAYAEEPAA